MDHRSEGPGENGVPVPRDLPDQQAHEGEDPWEVGAGRAQGDTVDTTEAAKSAEPDSGESGADVPDTDEAGTGREGAPRSGAVHPEQPVPDEPAD
ncbi:hypothetical protein [Streptomyces resistomycificus]|uniref:Uncharacterized protein n=1 Tax=Streptomyces resistomycificus TaxID=67356 RepID=A0A0L8LUD2_9ACTN|nr:hypothetical protein [Streptomyces resistomycificus]KOG41761.1 hypothetical protein ADK37_06610 [Streptomyces resistomycificus]KUN95812.1 hypothetical protein AQJ84_21785 [Streptomyces resistomycificus]